MRVPLTHQKLIEPEHVLPSEMPSRGVARVHQDEELTEARSRVSFIMGDENKRNSGYRCDLDSYFLKITPDDPEKEEHWVRTVAEPHMKKVTKETEAAMRKVGARVLSATRRVKDWAGWGIAIKPTYSFDYKADLHRNSDLTQPVKDAEVILTYGGGSARSPFPSFTMFESGVIDDVIDGRDFDFFPTGMEQLEQDYFSLIAEIRKPGSTNKPGKMLKLYTARPSRDRSHYQGARNIPAGLFLTNSYDRVQGIAMELARGDKRDIWRVQIDSRYLHKTLDVGRQKDYQVTKEAPVKSIKLVDRDIQLERLNEDDWLRDTIRSRRFKHANADKIVQLISVNSRSNLNMSKVRREVTAGGEWYLLTRIPVDAVSINTHGTVTPSGQEDVSKPIVVGKGRAVLDGRHRVALARQRGISSLPAWIAAGELRSLLAEAVALDPDPDTKRKLAQAWDDWRNAPSWEKRGQSAWYAVPDVKRILGLEPSDGIPRFVKRLKRKDLNEESAMRCGSVAVSLVKPAKKKKKKKPKAEKIAETADDGISNADFEKLSDWWYNYSGGEGDGNIGYSRDMDGNGPTYLWSVDQTSNANLRLSKRYPEIYALAMPDIGSVEFATKTSRDGRQWRRDIRESLDEARKAWRKADLNRKARSNPRFDHEWLDDDHFVLNTHRWAEEPYVGAVVDNDEWIDSSDGRAPNSEHIVDFGNGWAVVGVDWR